MEKVKDMEFTYLSLNEILTQVGYHSGSVFKQFFAKLLLVIVSIPFQDFFGDGRLFFIWFVLMCLDYVMGRTAAYKSGEFKRYKLHGCVFKLMTHLMCIFLAGALTVAYAIAVPASMGAVFGGVTPVNGMLLFLVTNEVSSTVHSMHKMGLPISNDIMNIFKFFYNKEAARAKGSDNDTPNS